MKVNVQVEKICNVVWDRVRMEDLCKSLLLTEEQSQKEIVPRVDHVSIWVQVLYVMVNAIFRMTVKTNNTEDLAIEGVNTDLSKCISSLVQRIDLLYRVVGCDHYQVWHD